MATERIGYNLGECSLTRGLALPRFRPKAEPATAGRRLSGAPAEGQPPAGGDTARERDKPIQAAATRISLYSSRST